MSTEPISPTSAASTIGPRVPYAEVTWADDGVPTAPAFDDSYFKPADPVGERRYVFLEGCALATAWAGRSRFAIGETGFGTGLSLLLAIDLWRRTMADRPKGARLDILSVEGYPMRRADLARAHAAFPPDLADLADRLRAAWPPPYRGFHSIAFEDLGVSLTLILDQADRGLRQAEARIDAWFLDGFAPARNAGMWDARVLAQIARLSAPGARLATYTAAVSVRDGLARLGATVTRHDGFGYKQHCLRAVMPDDAAQAPPKSRPRWCPPPACLGPGDPVIVIGNGIAARWAALKLVARGLAVTRIGPDGSAGPPAALIAPKLVRGDTAHARLSIAGYVRALAAFDAIAEEVPALWYSRTVIEPSSSAALNSRQAVLAEHLDWPADWLCPEQDGLHHPKAGVINTGLLQDWLDHAFTRQGGRWCEASVAGLARDQDGWHATDGDGRLLASALTAVVAAGADGFDLLPDGTDLLAARHAGGRLFLIKPPGDGALPPTALSYGGFITPRLGQPFAQHADAHALLGSSARAARTPRAAYAEEAASADDSYRLCRARLADARPDLAAHLPPDDLPESWVGVRTTTPDHLPLVGAVPDVARFRETFHTLALGARDVVVPGQMCDHPGYHAGLFTIAALGARGYQMAPLLADLIACQLTGAPTPIAGGDVAALHPARYLFRTMKRESSNLGDD